VHLLLFGWCLESNVLPSQTEAVSLLKTISLDVGYEGRVLFQNLDVSLDGGKLICFMGPNGAGKSSLIRTLAGIQAALGGFVIKPQNTTNSSHISVVLTDKIAASNLKVKDLVALGRYPYLDWHVTLTAEDDEIVEQAIRQTHLENIRDARVTELSDGQLQMVMIARALTQNTPVILLDEPTAHLDLNNRIDIMKLLRSLAKQQDKAILVATHELDLALQTADIIWLAGKNKNILTGIPEDLVLNGSFDSIFEFKGYDLKSGKVSQESYRNRTVLVKGTGHVFLWTKNALERNGFLVDSAPDIVFDNQQEYIEITFEESKPRWILHKNNRLYRHSTIAELIEQV